MDLFNFISFTLPPQLFLSNLSNQEFACERDNSKTPSIMSDLLRVTKLETQVYSFKYHSNYKLLVATESVYRFSRNQTIDLTLFQELLHKYWQQTIFLSAATPASQKYTNQLAKQENIITKTKKKKLLIGFSQALLYGQINFNTTLSTKPRPKTLLSYNKYIWRKGLNLAPPKFLNGLWVNRRCPNFPNTFQFNLLKSLRNNRFPLFIVVNDFNQLIVSEPANKLTTPKSINNTFYQWYYDRFLWQKDSSRVYEGWFFVNPKDAKEYKNFIAYKYRRSFHQNGLAVISSGIDFYYRLNRIAPPHTEFRLFPDLEEISELIISNKNKPDLIFDEKQNYGRSHFQGQPIYFIESVSCKKKNSSTNELINYYYQIPTDSSNKKYTAIFLNKEVALQGWQQFCENMPQYKLPKKPILRVYNLEDFLKDNECKYPVRDKDFIFIPGKDSYKEIEHQYFDQDLKNSYQYKNTYLFHHVLSCKLWLQRIIWSLTSRQPPSW
jgi:hypothetical protein